jgi:hypothetical protein
MKQLVSAALVFVLLFTAEISHAQFSDNFNDGDFTTSPAWVGGISDWIVNPSFQLQSNNLVANSQYYLSTPSTLSTSTQWEFYAKIDFNPSSANYVDVYLTSSASDLTNAAITGYFVRIGNTLDEICLYRKDAANTGTKIIDGQDNILNVSTSVMKIKVTRNAANQWTLYRDLSGTGNTYVADGAPVVDATFTTSSFFGIYVKQSTSTFFQKHYFDDIEVKAFVPDVTPPVIVSASATSVNTVDVLFNEPVDLTTSQVVANYVANNGLGTPTSAVRDASNTSLVHLTYAANFPSGTNVTLTINNVQDLSSNAIVNGTTIFSFYIPKRYDAVIDEIFADPTPVVALPNAEFIEIKNTSGRTLNLLGWKVSSTSTTSAALPSYVLPADSFLVITTTTSAPLFSGYGRVLGITSFPAIDNAGTTLTLTSKEGVTIHSVTYSDAWYGNVLKQDGGWTLEMIDTRNPCNGANNWKASVDPRGGTPAAKNSVDANNPDPTAPTVVRAAAIDNLNILLTFSEPIDSTTGAAIANYSISDGVNAPITATVISPSFNKVQLRINATNPIAPGKVYTITVSNIKDCSGNTIQPASTARFGLSSPIDSFGIVINEVLFNPKSGGVDYVEIVNRSSKIYDMKDLYLANRSSTTNAIGSIRQVSTDNLQLFPGDYLVLSENSLTVKQQYNAINANNFVDVSSFPSYPDDKGVVVLLNAQGNIIDELRYDSKWHFALIDNDEGISLERISIDKPTQDQSNWHSAASTVGFGTPTYLNSQFRSDLALPGEVTVTPKVFSPDNDGFDDFAVINYQLDAPNYVANITIFDAAGRAVKVLAKNATLAQKGSFRWDGLSDKQVKVPVGAYVIYTEVFNLDGRRSTFKNTVVVAVRF